MNDKKRPYVVLNAAMSLDGKIATISGDSEFSSEEDWKRVHKLRSEMDAVMVGINTVIQDDPKLYLKYHTPKKFWRIIIDSQARTPPTAKLFQMDPEIYPVLIAVTAEASKTKLKELEAGGAQIIRIGEGNCVDLKILMNSLNKLKIKRILLEGGGTLNFSMLKAQLVDEVIVSIAPVIVGGKNAVSFVDGKGVYLVKEGFQLEFIKFESLGNNLVLYFSIKK